VSYLQSGQVKATSDLRTALVSASTELAELDRLCSEDQIAERDMLLATTDAARVVAYREAADIRKLADTGWAAIGAGAGLPGDVRSALSTLRRQYAEFLDDVDAQQKTLAPIDPSSAEGAAALNVVREHTATARAKIKTVRDLMAVRVERARRDTDATVTTIRGVVLSVGLVGLVLLVGASVLIARSITRPLRALGERMAQIADGDGDLTARLVDTARDEIGAVARGRTGSSRASRVWWGRWRPRAARLPGRWRGSLRCPAS
jgi:methyl-accepting chemotaxis protein